MQDKIKSTLVNGFARSVTVIAPGCASPVGDLYSLPTLVEVPIIDGGLLLVQPAACSAGNHAPSAQ
jgi:hypothetical protein